MFGFKDSKVKDNEVCIYAFFCVYRGAQFEFEIQFEFREKNIVRLPTNCVKTILT